MPELDDARTMVPMTAEEVAANDIMVLYDESSSTLKKILVSEFGDLIAGEDDSPAASSAIQAPQPSDTNVILYHDEMTGDNASIVLSGTRTMVPGPGTWTVGQATNQTYFRIENGVMRAVNLPFATGAGQIDANLTPVAAGLAMRVRMVIGYQPGFVASKTKIGFGLTVNNGPNTRGVISFEKGNSENNVRLWISRGNDNTDTSLYNAGFGVVLPGEEVEAVVYYKTLTHQEYFVRVPRSGCPIDSERWHKIGETFMDLSASAGVYPYIAHEHSGVSEIHEVTVYSQWSPGNRANLFDYSRTLQGTHIPTLARDPLTELVVLGWNRGLTHVGQGLSEIRGNVRLANGQWTTPTTWLAAPSSPAGQSICNISRIGNSLWLMYWKTANGAVEGGSFYRRSISINPSDGAVMLGVETALSGITGTQNLNFSPIITLASGRLMMTYHKSDGSPALNSYVAYSTDGVNWTSNSVSASIPAGMNVLVEGSLVEESDGAVGLYLRNQSGSVAYSRCSNPNDPTPTWTTPRSLGSIPDPYSRSRVIKTDDGQILLIGNDSRVYRRDVSIWRMGDNGVMQDRTFIADWNPADATGSVSQHSYPDLLQDGGDLVIAWTQQESGGVNLACGIRHITIRWTDPVSLETGGSGRQDQEKNVYIRPTPKVTTIPYSTTPTPHLSTGSPNFALTLTASTATVASPAAPMGYEEIKFIITQGGAGSFTLAWDSGYEFNGTTPTLRTAVNASNIFVFIFNPVSQKWVLQSFN